MDVKRLLENHAVGKADNTNDPNQQIAGTAANSYQSPTWGAELNAAMQDLLVQIYVDGMETQTAQIGAGFVQTDLNFQVYAQDYAQARTADLVTMLDDSTRNMLKNDISNMLGQGLSPQQIADELTSGSYAFSDQRALVIARTETAFAWNDAGVSTYEAGGAKGVTVYDGDYDPECAQADGETWSFDYAREHLTEHPNCVRSFGPYFGDDPLDRE